MSDRCPATRPRYGWLCDYVGPHPGPVHVTWRGGELRQWIAETRGWTNRLVVPADPEQDAPDALRTRPRTDTP